MNRILLEHELFAIKNFIITVDPNLGLELETMIESGTWTEIPRTQKGESVKKTFVTHCPLKKRSARDVLEYLEIMSKSPKSGQYIFRGITIHGAFSAWQNFIT